MSGNRPPSIPVIRRIERTHYGDWYAHAHWGNRATGSYSRYRWLAPIKAIWNIVAFRLFGADKFWWT